MSILSIYYLIFLAIAGVIYYITPKKCQWCVLLAASVVFFVAACGWGMLLYVGYTLAITYIGVWKLDQCKEEKRKKGILIGTIILALAILFPLKYVNFFTINGSKLARLFNIQIAAKQIFLAAPIGISYYTLSVVGYVLDVYWGKCQRQRNLFKHALYMLWFPSLTSGPVLQYEKIRESLFGGHSFSYRNIAFGAQRILWGLFKKMVIANTIVTVIDTVYANPEQYPGLYIVFAVICYAVYLYSDFSGCIDIIIGSADIFGVTMPENFRQPFFSQSTSEFWRRWHISLGEWFKEYLLYPLLKSRVIQKIGRSSKKKFGKKLGKQIPTWLGLMPLWFLTGFWHGGSWKYIVASGVIPCCYQILGEFCTPLFEKIKQIFGVRTECFSYRLFCRIRTFFCICLIFLFVNSESLTHALHMLKMLFGTFNPWVLMDGSIFTLGVDEKHMLILGLCLVVVWVVSILKEQGKSVRAAIAEQNLVFQWGLWIVLIVSICMLSPSTTEGVRDFLYAQF